MGIVLVKDVNNVALVGPVEWWPVKAFAWKHVSVLEIAVRVTSVLPLVFKVNLCVSPPVQVTLSVEQGTYALHNNTVRLRLSVPPVEPRDLALPIRSVQLRG